MRAPVPVLLMTRELGIGGTERQLCEIAKALDRKRFQPHVACFHSRGFRAEELRAAGVPILHLPVRSFKRPGAIKGAWQLRNYIRRERIALVHTFDVPMNQFGVPVARASGAAVVLSSQRAHRDLVSPAVRRLLRLTDRLVDGIVVNSQAVGRQLIEEDRVPPERIHLCYNAIDTARFFAGPRVRPSALRDASVVFGVVCALRPEKGLATLLDAFAEVHRADAASRLVIVGDGPVLEDLKARCSALGLDGACRFESATDRVAEWLHAIDVFVLPSLSEALSNSLMEAMACGCCAVASRTGGNPELIEHERTGLLFTPGDAAGLAQCLKRLAGDFEFRQRLADAGAAFIQKFSLEASVRRMEQIYAGFLLRRSKRCA
ncbi:MAG TPA: glycosyltransferase [Bryobacteraceae bacterium]|nr:glycosyltransferase [Bryobacteraceae bacterium]HOL70819.1 glycosyltransferase [Bryobacteraceae bacterium]HPQ17114.1 glycosyltransferase [Bryobacteraceae bacterium]